MNKLRFLGESLKNLRTVGTFTRSSQFLCEKMVSYVDFAGSKVLVELGAGDGVVTEHILKNMRDDALLLAFEVNDKFCKTIEEKISDPRVRIIQDSAENLPKYLKQYNCDKVDNIISAIPFVSLPDEVGKNIIKTSVENLKPNGRFIQINYSLLAKKLYEQFFENIEVHFEARNMPPAFVLECYN